MKLITFSGVDGSGKSTQLALLKKKLEQEGRKIFYFHAIEFSLANRLTRFLKGEANFVAGKERASTKSSWLALQLRKLFLLIDIYRFKMLYAKIEQERYDFILSDRYFYDSVINILYLSHSQTSLCVEKYIQKPDYAFYFHISPKEIMQRDRVPEQGMEYLKSKIALFEQKKEALGLLSVNASQNETAFSQTIFTHITF